MTTGIFTDIEQIVNDWLVKNKVNFTPQASYGGGRFELGGAIADFTLDELGIILRVHGEYWHKGVEKEGTDAIQQEIFESQGWQVVNIWGSTLDTPARIEETLSKALIGEEML